MHKNATKCNKTQSKWCINKHGASKIIDTFETYHPPSAPLPVGRGGEGMRAVVRIRVACSLFCERSLCSCSGVSSCRVPPHLAGRGGGEVSLGGAASTKVGGEFWKALEIWLHATIPRRRLLPAAATQGHRVGHTVLDDDDEVASSFFLCERIFCSVTAASKSPAQPSGLVPG
jgi:hypothetical protein